MFFSRSLLRHFALWTSASGLPHIAKSHNKCSCIFWIVAFIACLATFVYQMSVLIVNYRSFPVSVSTKLKFQSLKFPVVTICNLNPYKQSQIYKVQRLADLLENYVWAVSGNQSLQNDPWGLQQTSSDPLDIQSNARSKIVYVTSKLTEDQIASIGYTLDELVIGCTFDEISCDLLNDFERYIDETFGVCYKYNSKINGIYYSTRVGSSFGLRLLLNINLSEYLHTTESAGIRITVTNQGEETFPDAFGYNTEAGLTTSFSLRYITTERLGQPYGNCTTLSADKYSVEHCYRTCLQENIIKQCGCADPRFHLPVNQTYCDIDKYECVMASSKISDSAFNDTQSTQTGFDVQRFCDCPQLCVETTYTLAVSNAVWPARGYTPAECFSNKIFNGNLSACADWLSHNTLMVEVYYERLNYEQYKESPAYPLISLISDFGGQIGLWIGVSVITMFEFLFIPFLCCMYCFGIDPNLRRRSKPTVNVFVDDENMFDAVGTKVKVTAPKYPLRRQSDFMRPPPLPVE